MFNSGSMPRREAQIYGQMLDSAINVHHNVTQFPQDLTLHKPRRPGSDSRERAREHMLCLGMEMEIRIHSHVNVNT